ncbi:unnamed protein product [Acanthoscelides obtectus]|uniref:Uncharacterized protein n=1 Tax=Acanthoscelides obtectus TaxID=200917 RepID=A0A9P0NV40_ACAOB|nr:unnamed protein product [Acanthoscelides obtectus]CAK1666987.1 hypothetical protein AOBTE_LOCUS25600 [Acanthoscelides obtectus]
MSERSLDELHDRLEKGLKFSNQVRVTISSVERLCVCIRYLVSGNIFTDIHYTYRLGISTISDIVSMRRNLENNQRGLYAGTIPTKVARHCI